MGFWASRFLFSSPYLQKTTHGGYWWVSHAAGAGLLIAYYFTLPAPLHGPHYINIYHYGLFIIGIHLLMAIGPYLGKPDQMAFWQYNKLLFLQFITALLFSTVLYIGLAIALLAIQTLLGFDINYEFYLQLYAFVGIMFNTWFRDRNSLQYKGKKSLLILLTKYFSF